MPHSGWNANPFLFTLPPFAGPGEPHIEFVFGDQIPPDLQQFYSVDIPEGPVIAALIFYDPNPPFTSYTYIAQVTNTAGGGATSLTFGFIDPSTPMPPSMGSHGIFISETYRLDATGDLAVWAVNNGFPPSLFVGGAITQPSTGIAFPQNQFALGVYTDFAIYNGRTDSSNQSFQSSVGRGPTAYGEAVANVVVNAGVETNLLILDNDTRTILIPGRTYRATARISHTVVAGTTAVRYRIRDNTTGAQLAGAYAPAASQVGTTNEHQVEFLFSSDGGSAVVARRFRLTCQISAGTYTATPATDSLTKVSLLIEDVGGEWMYPGVPSIVF